MPVRAIGISQKQFCLVLHLDGSILCSATRLHRNGHPTDPLHQIQLVRSLRHQNAAALALPAAAPRTGGIVSISTIQIRDDPGAAHQFADLSLLHHLLHSTEAP